jgi:signal transduction histidine kinase
MVKVVRKKLGTSSISWLFVGAMFALCAILGGLQYRWIGEVSVAERERLQQRLQSDLNRLSRDFNTEIAAACRALLPQAQTPDAPPVPYDLTARYEQWKKTTRRGELFEAIALAIPRDEHADLQRLDLATGKLTAAEWPADWQNLRTRIDSHLSPDGWRQRGQRFEMEGHVFEIPLFGMGREPGRDGGGPRGPFRHPENGWLIVDLNPTYLREVTIPELVQRHIGNAVGGLDYQVDVVTRGNGPSVIYESSANAAHEIAGGVDASVGLFDIQFDQLYPRPEPPGATGGGGGRAGFGAGFRPDMGRWQMNVRHRAGSLEAVVTSTRRRSMAVTGAVLLLLVATAFALLRFTRRAQRLARLQMDFVAGVSHELRTPLAVIYGAAYNLRGAVARNPSQVEKYGALLQQESGRLRDLVEQVLRFSSAEAGNVIREREPISVHDLIDQATAGQAIDCEIEKRIDPSMPIVLGDPLALKHALQNLVVNAAKYGQSGSDGRRWIGVSASPVMVKDDVAVEIRVADHGPGIPADEQEHVFDAFFRGRRAIQDQIHGTGLGLNLVKKIVEAHGGTVRVESEVMKGTEFVVRLPATKEREDRSEDVESSPVVKSGVHE